MISSFTFWYDAEHDTSEILFIVRSFLRLSKDQSRKDDDVYSIF